MDALGLLAYDAEERKRQQNRLAQRRHRLKVKALQSQDAAEADRLHPSPPLSQSHLLSSTDSVTPPNCNPAVNLGSGPSETDLVHTIDQNTTGQNTIAATRMVQQPCNTGLCPEALPADLFSLDDIFPAHAVETLEMERFPPAPHPAGSSKATPAVFSGPETTTGSLTRDTARVLLDAEHRLGRIMDEIFNMGFDNLEAMVIEYYTLDLHEDSTIGHTQHLSRKRHIRSLILALSHGAGNSPDEEARPLREEILKAAEVLYAAEVERLRALHWPGSNADLAQLWEGVMCGHSKGSSVEMVVYRDMRPEVR